HFIHRKRAQRPRSIMAEVVSRRWFWQSGAEPNCEGVHVEGAPLEKHDPSPRRAPCIHPNYHCLLDATGSAGTACDRLCRKVSAGCILMFRADFVLTTITKFYPQFYFNRRVRRSLGFHPCAFLGSF